ncbi:MAG TPA: oligosaccharide flippase family protein [Candidatus Acidoferrales bacterium]|nr:oligosaccharide flippase family protein [Candidatus Acidoferrales bacterium]
MSAETSDVLAVRQGARPSLRSEFTWMLAGNAVYAGGQFATLMLLAKLIRPELVGQYALGLAVVYPVMLLTNLQLRAVLTSGARERTHFGHFLSLRLLTTSLALLIIFAITRVLTYSWNLTAVVLMVGVSYGIEAISDVYYARLQRDDKMAEISKSLIARALLSVLGLALATYLSGSLLWGIAGIALARAIVLFGYDIRKRTHGLSEQSEPFNRNEALAPRFNLNVQRDLLWLSFPLGIVVLLSSLNSYLPSYFIKSALGERDLGIFTAIGFMVSVGNMAVVSLGQSAFTRLARSYAAGNHVAFGSLLCKLLAFGAAVGVCGIVISKFAGREILTILFRPEYAERADLLPWIMAAGGVIYMAQFLGFGLTAAGYYNSQVVLNILANLGLLLACFWLVARQGLFGAIIAMLVAAIVQLAGSIVVLAVSARMHGHRRGERFEPRHGALSAQVGLTGTQRS